MESPRNADLPVDIIRGILLMQPVKTLSRFKCVSKQWCTLIESQSFVNDHFVNERNQERLVVFKPESHRLVYVDESSSGIEEPDHLPMPGKVHDVMGPVNGVFCVVSKSGGMGLLNPAVSQFKPLPPHLTSCDSFLGFGLDPLSGHYKVVSIQVFWREEFNSPITMYPPLVHVYNSGSGSWRLLEDVHMFNSMQCAFRSKCNTFLNGVYYWVVQYRDPGFGILAFDMSSEEFKIIQIPDALIDGGREFELELAVRGDSLVLFSYNSFDRRNDMFIDMWILENDGWSTKSSTFGPFRDLRSPLGFWKNNDLMIETNTSLLTLYNISTHEFRPVEARGQMMGIMSYFRNWVYTYKESLLSLKGEGEGDNCMLWDISSPFIINFFKGIFGR